MLKYGDTRFLPYRGNIMEWDENVVTLWNYALLPSNLTLHCWSPLLESYFEICSILSPFYILESQSHKTFQIANAASFPRWALPDGDRAVDIV